jgi:hypothetical protein
MVPHWLPFRDDRGLPIAEGSESGAIVLDEEHEPWGARITLERDTKHAPAAITCGLYGWMLHTRYFQDLEAARREYEAMKIELSALVALVPFESDPDLRRKSSELMQAISAFVAKYP